MRRGFLLLGVVLPMLTAGAGCDVTTDVRVDVDESGSGAVTVSVGLDDDALTRLPSLDDLVKVEDLDAAGWAVTGPERDRENVTWLRATKPFDTPEEANAVLAEISGPDGPFRDLMLTRDRALARTDLAMTGTVDLTGGLATFSDAALAQSLEGQPLGESLDQIEARLGARVADVFSFRFAVRLPGDLESNADRGDATGAAVWTPSLADTAPTAVTASTRLWRETTLLALSIGAVALVLLIVWVVVRVSRRSRTRPRGIEAPAPEAPEHAGEAVVDVDREAEPAGGHPSG